MTEEQEKDRGFKVEDRRRFSAEGEVKPEFRDQPDEVEKASPSAGEQGNAALKSGTKTAGEPSEVTFSAFIVGLSTQALVHLGEIPDPVTNQQSRDLAGASQLIDILGMLQQKSRGNLSPEEERLLESILYDLRMRYVALTR
jgi:hypothetical protein